MTIGIATLFLHIWVVFIKHFKPKWIAVVVIIVDPSVFMIWKTLLSSYSVTHRKLSCLTKSVYWVRLVYLCPYANIDRLHNLYDFKNIYNILDHSLGHLLYWGNPLDRFVGKQYFFTFVRFSSGEANFSVGMANLGAIYN